MYNKTWPIKNMLIKKQQQQKTILSVHDILKL